jgi:hypothetical protein
VPQPFSAPARRRCIALQTPCLLHERHTAALDHTNLPADLVSIAQRTVRWRRITEGCLICHGSRGRYGLGRRAEPSGSGLDDLPVQAEPAAAAALGAPRARALQLQRSRRTGTAHSGRVWVRLRGDAAQHLRAEGEAVDVDDQVSRGPA